MTNIPDNATLAFAGGTLNRLSEARNDTSLTDAMAKPETKTIAFAGAKPLLQFIDGQAQCWHMGHAELQLEECKAILLGTDEIGHDWIAAPSLVDTEHLPEGLKAIDLRSIVAQGLISGAELGALAYGAALINWHNNNGFCGKCGSASAIASAGAKRFCAHCNTEHFPRTDPVAIMMVVKGDQCLLGRGPHFPSGMYSCLAGFIEAGETIEDAVRRETFEESGIQLGSVTYIASQPWPMPHSLMIGCIAEAVTDTVDFDTNELEDCRWFSKAEVQSMIEGTHLDGLSAPFNGAIAGSVIAKWVDSK